MENQNQMICKPFPYPPDDLAGYQAIVHGVSQDGDVLVLEGSRTKSWAHGGQLNCPVDILKSYGYDVYRKLACPKPGGDEQFNRDQFYRDFDSFQSKFGPTPEIRGCCPPGPAWDFQPQPGNKAKTSDEGKPPLAHLPWAGLREVAQVQAYGHKKYGDFHNYKKGMELSRNISCAMRHLSEFMDGKDLDDESKCSHLAHAACRILFALENISDGTQIDDRFKPTKK